MTYQPNLFSQSHHKVQCVAQNSNIISALLSTVLSTVISAALILSLGCQDEDQPRPEQSAGEISAGEINAGEISEGGNDVEGEARVEEQPLGPYQVRLALGVLEGRADESLDGPTISFLGVPYARPPVGVARLKPTELADAWEGIKLAHDYGAICPQNGPLTDRSRPQSEDCLTLNLWVPTEEGSDAINTSTSKPVMVWIHGGGFVQGAGSAELYNGARLAARGGLIVVTLNYRLGALGFLNTRRLIKAEMTDEYERAHASGNFGIQDQITALRWVQKYISEFGGDPANVTIFGESAGGFSICALLGAPSARGLFKRAVIQSGGGCSGFAQLGPDLGRSDELADTPAERRASDLLAALGCAELSGAQLHQCLEALPVEAFIENESASGESVLGLAQLGPVTDGTLIEERADHALRDLLSSDTPEAVPQVIMGSNADEMTLFTFNLPITQSFYQSVVEGTFGLLADSIFELYPAESDDEARSAYNQLLSDLIFICPTLKFATTLREGRQRRSQDEGALPVWIYHFTHSLSSGLPALLGATHALEIPFVFNNTHLELYGASAVAADETLAEQMSDAWISFARSGSPSLESLEWSPYHVETSTQTSIDEGRVMLWSTTPRVDESPLRNGRCQALDELNLLRGVSQN